MQDSSRKLFAIGLGLLLVAVAAKPLISPEPYLPLQQLVTQRVSMKLAIARDAKHPAVWLGGGSNVLSGLRAADIAREMRRPVYNLALVDEAGDYRNALALLEAVAQPEDTVVYSSRGFLTSVPHFTKSTPYDLDGLKILLPDLSEAVELIDRSVLRLLLQTQIQTVRPSPWEQFGNYSRLGDYEPCLVNRTSTSAQLFSGSVRGQDEFIKDLGGFSARLADRNIRVFFVIPDLLVVQSEEVMWNGLRQRVQASLAQAGGRWLNSEPGANFLSDPNVFCDTPLHPGAERAKMKSRSLAIQLSEQN
jgi:hypothetical protein